MSKNVFPSLWTRALSAVGDFSNEVLTGRFEEALDQEIRQLDGALKSVKEKHDEYKAQRIHAQQQVAPLKKEQAELEEQVVRLLRGRRKAQAKQKADEIAALGETILTWNATAAKALVQEKECAVSQGEIERTLKLRRYQLGALRASANLSRTQEALASALPGEQPATARDALNRLKGAFYSKLPDPDDVLGEPPEPMAESSSEILERLAQTTRPSTSPPKAKKIPSKSRKAQ